MVPCGVHTYSFGRATVHFSHAHGPPSMHMRLLRGDRAPDGRVGLEWGDEVGQSFGTGDRFRIVGTVQRGRNATAPRVLRVDLDFWDLEVEGSHSWKGECTVSVRILTADSIAGVVDCPQGMTMLPEYDRTTPPFTARFSASGSGSAATPIS